MWCSLDIHIVNGRTNGDREGNYTCIANGGKSVVDYFLASSDIFPKSVDFNLDDADCF